MSNITTPCKQEKSLLHLHKYTTFKRRINDLATFYRFVCYLFHYGWKVQIQRVNKVLWWRHQQKSHRLSSKETFRTLQRCCPSAPVCPTAIPGRAVSNVLAINNWAQCRRLVGSRWTFFLERLDASPSPDCVRFSVLFPADSWAVGN